MKKITFFIIFLNMMICECNGAENQTASQKQPAGQIATAGQTEGSMSAEVNKAADDIEKQIDSLSADINSTAKVLKERLPVIMDKFQDLMSEVQVSAQSIQNATATPPRAGQKK